MDVFSSLTNNYNLKHQDVRVSCAWKFTPVEWFPCWLWCIIMYRLCGDLSFKHSFEKNVRIMMEVIQRFFPLRCFRFLNVLLLGFVPRFPVIFLVHNANFEEKQRKEHRKEKQVQLSTDFPAHTWHVDGYFKKTRSFLWNLETTSCYLLSLNNFLNWIPRLNRTICWHRYSQNHLRLELDPKM